LQSVDLSSYVGKRLSLSAWLRSSAVDESGGLLFLISGPAGQAVGNQRYLSMHGTKEWSRRYIVFDVDETAVELRIGFGLSGPGVIWADDFSINVVDPRTPLTRVFPSAPVDTDFDVPQR
jgi:hypothetical protein